MCRSEVNDRGKWRFFTAIMMPNPLLRMVSMLILWSLVGLTMGQDHQLNPQLQISSAEHTPEDWLRATALLTNAVFGLRGSHVLIPCTGSGSGESEFINPIFAWRDRDDHALSDSRLVMQESGDLLVTDLEAEDSGLYSCDVTASGTTSSFSHNLIVYVLPNFINEVHVEYDVADCGDSFVSMKTSQLQLALCPAQPCVFSVRVRCVLKRKQNVAGVAEMRHLLLVTITQAAHNNFRPPSCDVACMKSSITRHLEEHYTKITEVLEAEQTSPGMGFRFLPDSMTKQLKFSCRPGYHPHAQQACLPCVPGWYSLHDAATCSPCRRGTYQTKFAQSRCIVCDNHGTTSHVGTSSPDDCKDETKLTLTLSMSKRNAKTDGVVAGIVVGVVVIIIVVLIVIARKKRHKIQTYLESKGGPLAPLLMKDMKEAQDRESQKNKAAQKTKSKKGRSPKTNTKRSVSKSSQVTPRLNASEMNAPFCRSLSMLSDLAQSKKKKVPTATLR